MSNPQTYGKLSSYSNEQDCAGPRAVHVPIRFSAPIAAAGALVYTDQIDLTSFLIGNPAPYLDGLQSMIAYQLSKTGGALSADAFLSDLQFNNGYKCIAPGRAYSAVSVIADNAPIIDLAVYTISSLSSATDVEIDFYFTNFAVDQAEIRV